MHLEAGWGEGVIPTHTNVRTDVGLVLWAHPSFLNVSKHVSFDVDVLFDLNLSLRML